TARSWLEGAAPSVVEITPASSRLAVRDSSTWSSPWIVCSATRDSAAIVAAPGATTDGTRSPEFHNHHATASAVTTINASASFERCMLSRRSRRAISDVQRQRVRPEPAGVADQIDGVDARARQVEEDLALAGRVAV